MVKSGCSATENPLLIRSFPIATTPEPLALIFPLPDVSVLPGSSGRDGTFTLAVLYTSAALEPDCLGKDNPALELLPVSMRPASSFLLQLLMPPSCPARLFLK